MSSIANFPPGTYVTVNTHANLSEEPVFGTVVGLTMNSFGELVLVIDLVRNLGNDRRELLEGTDWICSEYDRAGVVWTRRAAMHHTNVSKIESTE